MALLGSGTEQDPYLIGSYDDFLQINSHRGIGRYFRQTADIQLGVRDGRLPMSLFQGIYDGDGFKLIGGEVYSNLSSPTGDWGIWRTIDSATFKNLIIDGFVVFAGYNAGVFAGTSYENCSFENVVLTEKVMSRTYTLGSNWYAVGGFIGRAEYPVTFKTCGVNSRTVEGNRMVGGFIGYDVSSTGSTYDQCYSNPIEIRTLTGTFGAFHGTQSMPPKITNSYNTYSSANSQGSTLITRNQLKDQSQLTMFDFENRWAIKSDILSGFPIPKAIVPIVVQIEEKLLNVYTKLLKSNNSRFGNRFRSKVASTFTRLIGSNLEPKRKSKKEENIFVEKMSAISTSFIRRFRLNELVGYIKNVNSEASRKTISLKDIVNYSKKVGSKLTSKRNFYADLKLLIKPIDLKVENIFKRIRHFSTTSYINKIKSNSTAFNILNKALVVIKTYTNKIYSDNIASVIRRKLLSTRLYMKNIDYKTVRVAISDKLLVSHMKNINFKIIKESIKKRIKEVNSNIGNIRFAIKDLYRNLNIKVSSNSEKINGNISASLIKRLIVKSMLFVKNISHNVIINSAMKRFRLSESFTDNFKSSTSAKIKVYATYYSKKIANKLKITKRFIRNTRIYAKRIYSKIVRVGDIAEYVTIIINGSMNAIVSNAGRTIRTLRLTESYSKRFVSNTKTVFTFLSMIISYTINKSLTRVFGNKSIVNSKENKTFGKVNENKFNTIYNSSKTSSSVTNKNKQNNGGGD